MTSKLDRKRAALLSAGFLARVASPAFKAGRLSRTLAGGGRGAITESLYGIVLDVPESRTLVEVAVENLREEIAAPLRADKIYWRAIDVEALETGEWLLTGVTSRQLLRESLRLRTEHARSNAATHGLPDGDEVGAFMAVAWLAGECQQAIDFYEWSKRTVTGGRTARGVALALCESTGASARPLVLKLLHRFMDQWFEHGTFADAIIWLRILNQLAEAPAEPWTVVRSARDYLTESA